MHWNRGTRKPVSPSLPVARLASWLVCATVVIGLAPAGRANTVEFATGPQNITVGTTVYPENATATFDITGSNIAVQLLNLIANPIDVNQAIGSLQFTVNGATGTLTPTIFSNTDTTLGIVPGGVIKNVAAQTTTNWTTDIWGQQVALCVVCAAVAGTTDLIIGGPNAVSGRYGAADATLTGTSAEWIVGGGLSLTVGKVVFDTSPSWVINFGIGTDLTNVVITNVIFGFGETVPYGSGFLPAEEVPEPGSVILFGTGLGLLAIAAGARRLRRR
jgi:PEP-CTERM motif